jgi:hypothetical protein
VPICRQESALRMSAVPLAMQKVEGSSPFSRLKVLLVPHFYTFIWCERLIRTQTIKGSRPRDLSRPFPQIRAVSVQPVEDAAPLVDVRSGYEAPFRIRSEN